MNNDPGTALNGFHLDFLCAGFNKCGTSSLASVLRRIPGIQLPLNKKETCFFGWCDNFSDPVEKLRSRYYPNHPAGDIILGSVEPSFAKRAERVYHFFGRDVKLVFMLRDPMMASWSMFKMRLRRVRGSRYTNLYRIGDGNIHAMFREYINRFIVTHEESDFYYDIWIENYLRYFPREQMKFIIFEDFIRNYEEQMADLGKFLNVPISDPPPFPKRNKNDLISKDLSCAMLNRKNYKFSRKLRKLDTNHEVFWNKKITPIIAKFTMKECTEKISDENREILEAIYLNSVLHTSELIGHPLINCWYGDLAK